ncbi:hypothetical protein Lal_00006141 [Lupinus albus]|uniref:Uncharacterized protein n=1 Tax=Lupinus albus TaxID=3870 RepID=A0A6A4Q8M0_LUPAL|nr:hypothetical protein Lalb_Chr07g0184931 [Lupinus albus]KAF1875513.1 hypothetical protein Lal_00006141 [Lupinus albus]
MATSSENKMKIFGSGSLSELFCFRTCTLFLMDYDQNQTIRLLGIGHFMVYLMMHIFYPIMITVCSVDGFHWPLTKDTVIFRMANRTFAFALPGLLYGLQFPPYCEDSLMDALEGLFTNFGHYIKVTGNKGLGFVLKDDDPLLWYRMRLRFEPMANEVLRELGQMPGKSCFNDSGHNPGYLRAIRMSACTKVLEDGMINSGILRQSHYTVNGTNPPNVNEFIGQYMAYASVNAITCMVDTLESAEILTRIGLGYLIKNDVNEASLETVLKKIGFKIWKLNELGVATFTHKLGPAVQEETETMMEKEEKWKAKDRERKNKEASANTTSGVGPSDKGKGLMP